MISTWMTIHTRIDWTWLAGLGAGLATNLLLTSQITSYLKTKAEGKKTLMDQAHLFLYSNLVWVCISSFLMNLIKETISLRKEGEWIAHAVDVLVFGIRFVFMASLALDFVTQYVLVMFPDKMTNLPVKDTTVAKVAKIACIGLMHLVIIIAKLAGTNFEVYSILTDTYAEHTIQTVPSVLLGILLAIVVVSGVATRSILSARFRNLNKPIPNNQILSNKVMMISVSSISIAVLFHVAYPQYQLRESINAFTLPFCHCTSVILLHERLRHQTLRNLVGMFTQLADLYNMTMDLAAKFHLFPILVRFVPLNSPTVIKDEEASMGMVEDVAGAQVERKMNSIAIEVGRYEAKMKAEVVE